MHFLGLKQGRTILSSWSKLLKLNTFIQYQQATYFMFHIGNNVYFNESI